MHFTTPLKSNSTKIMLIGSGELGKEVVIEASRLGIETVAVDSYPKAPAHLVANRSYVINMKNKEELLEVIRLEKPTFILPEVEALSIEALIEAEKEGFCVIPNADAVKKTMNRKNIREFAAETLGLKTSGYVFVKTLEALEEATKVLGIPCVVKPVMSSSGHGQSVIRSEADIQKAWEIAKEARGDASELIVEAFVPFDYEITLLTVRNGKETVFCEPIGHIQENGDYVLSWQPVPMKPEVLAKAQMMAKAVTDGLGGRGLFGVEFFVKDDEVYFSELSPRPHDTGMVTMITQSQSEFALHVRAVLGLPLDFTFYGAGASGAFKSMNEEHVPTLTIPESAFSKNSYVRIFGKPVSHVGRRMAVALVLDEVEAAKKRAREIVASMVG
ncbi:formate-dependent phosphoribosylglycinamide formyltransferase [Sulfurospirillum sp. hDNRA2]|uniref:formate-dependent phosphoribosylglycinamide formyltransferase n=1 Tax=Sulfurospirillum sp. hDNRA2 TaxID=3237298 RepID=UPI0020B817E8|nr:formate-dependent phosphoribosylglycinamide formyltransferase [Sulfurospirillum sp. DNRA8]MCP3652617.1 formate-dependent phosphoribosylglycinamide formyltransferase [Sulfurospirillum sp. DNRA8]MCR1811468.1 formate-dependent phosphoribosylglycinamide formyltransferase [Sulfurospirillum sp. DNRA8]